MRATLCRARTVLAIAFALAIGALAILAAGGDGAALAQPDFIRGTPAQVPWRDIPGGHGAQEATLFGDPDKAGLYVVRVKFPPHVMDVPHWHPNDRFVTVLEGTWYAGTGETFDPARAVPLGPGSFMLHPAKAVHWDGSRGDETVIVQIIGEGPGTTTALDPKQPFWVDVSHQRSP
ncbi:MAG TPA: cupin domain-containing protein [Steroidobacteraceae bacterium]|nr:cupin domain-containing protein [Steroidobacteraceae bacterium]